MGNVDKNYAKMIQDLHLQINNYCRFCNPPDKERILYESENFYIMLSLGPIVEGYLLLVSKQHIGCCADIPDEQFEEFIFLYEKVKVILKESYGNVICYEHGRAGSCLIPSSGSKHCFHAHMHFIPTKINLNELVKKDFKNSILLKDLSQLRKYFLLNGSPYLFAEDDKSMNIYPNIVNLKRQYLRFITSRAINQEELYDWVTYQGWEKINLAKDKLHSKFKIQNLICNQ